MLRPLIQEPLARKELQELVYFLSHHLGYVPSKIPKLIFVKSAKKFAEIYEGYKVKNTDRVDEINRECNVFFDHPTDTIVFAAYSYHEGKEIPVFVLPMVTMIHELIHFFQYSTGTFGTYRILYEGTNDLLAGFLVNDFKIDYKQEATYAFNLIMEMNDHDFWRSLQWMRTWTLHSDKNRFVHRSMKQCPMFQKYNPKKLLTALDNNALSTIENPDTQAVFRRYSLKRIIDICQKNRNIIQV